MCPRAETMNASAGAGGKRSYDHPGGGGRATEAGPAALHRTRNAVVTPPQRRPSPSTVRIRWPFGTQPYLRQGGRGFFHAALLCMCSPDALGLSPGIVCNTLVIPPLPPQKRVVLHARPTGRGGSGYVGKTNLRTSNEPFSLSIQHFTFRKRRNFLVWGGWVDWPAVGGSARSPPIPPPPWIGTSLPSLLPAPFKLSAFALGNPIETCVCDLR